MNEKMSSEMLELKQFLKENPIGTYVIRDLVTGKMYVGSTGQSFQRLSNHKSDLKQGVHRNKELQQVYNESGCADFHGRFSFEFTPTEDREEAYQLEQLKIDLNIGSNFLFNKAPDVKGVGVGGPLSEEHKAKIGQANKGKVLSSEQIEAMRLVNVGRKQSDETREKRRQSMLGKNVGKTHTAEVRERMSRLATGRVMSDEHRAKIAQGNTGQIRSEETKENIRNAIIAARGRKVSVNGVVFNTIRAAAIAHAITDGSAKDRVNSSSEKFAGWKFVD